MFRVVAIVSPACASCARRLRPAASSLLRHRHAHTAEAAARQIAPDNDGPDDFPLPVVSPSDDPPHLPPLHALSLSDAAATVARLRVAVQLAQPLRVDGASRAPADTITSSPLAARIAQNSQLHGALEAASAALTSAAGAAARADAEAASATLADAASLARDAVALSIVPGAPTPLRATTARLLVQLGDVGAGALVHCGGNGLAAPPPLPVASAALTLLRALIAHEVALGAGAPPIAVLHAIAAPIGAFFHAASHGAAPPPDAATLSLSTEAAALWTWCMTAVGAARGHKFIKPRVAALKVAARANAAAAALPPAAADAAASQLLFAAAVPVKESIGMAAAARALRTLLSARAHSRASLPKLRADAAAAFSPALLLAATQILAYGAAETAGDGSALSTGALGATGAAGHVVSNGVVGGGAGDARQRNFIVRGGPMFGGDALLASVFEVCAVRLTALAEGLLDAEESGWPDDEVETTADGPRDADGRVADADNETWFVGRAAESRSPSPHGDAAGGGKKSARPEIIVDVNSKTPHAPFSVLKAERISLKRYKESARDGIAAAAAIMGTSAGSTRNRDSSENARAATPAALDAVFTDAAREAALATGAASPSWDAAALPCVPHMRAVAHAASTLQKYPLRAATAFSTSHVLALGQLSSECVVGASAATALGSSAAALVDAIGDAAVARSLAGLSGIRAELSLASNFSQRGIHHRGLYSATARRIVARSFSREDGRLAHVPDDELIRAALTLATAWEFDRDAFGTLFAELRAREDERLARGGDGDGASPWVTPGDTRAAGGRAGGGALRAVVDGLTRSLSGIDSALAATPDFLWRRGAGVDEAEAAASFHEDDLSPAGARPTRTATAPDRRATVAAELQAAVITLHAASVPFAHYCEQLPPALLATALATPPAGGAPFIGGADAAFLDALADALVCALGAEEEVAGGVVEKKPSFRWLRGWRGGGAAVPSPNSPAPAVGSHTASNGGAVPGNDIRAHALSLFNIVPPPGATGRASVVRNFVTRDGLRLGLCLPFHSVAIEVVGPASFVANAFARSDPRAPPAVPSLRTLWRRALLQSAGWEIAYVAPLARGAPPLTRIAALDLLARSMPAQFVRK